MASISPAEGSASSSRDDPNAIQPKTSESFSATHNSGAPSAIARCHDISRLSTESRFRYESGIKPRYACCHEKTCTSATRRASDKIAVLIFMADAELKNSTLYRCPG